MNSLKLVTPSSIRVSIALSENSSMPPMIWWKP
jgi:hypothetical protein